MKTLIIAVCGLMLSGCFIVKKKPSSSSHAMTAPKNHGQERKQEVHARNDERKDAKDEAKGK